MKLVKFSPDKNTAVAFFLGVAIIVLSVTMLLFNGTTHETTINIIIRDLIMIFILGFCFPIFYVGKNENGYSALGITKIKLKLSLILNILFAAILLISFIFNTSAEVNFSYKHLFAMSYIMVAGIFEMVCIYGFLRYYFEKAFDIIPAILLTSLFYSLHHAGFQPEFFKLFFVGMMYCSVFYITRNILILFPFFWGVGAIWDVLINSSAGHSLQNATSFIIALLLLVLMLVFVIYQRRGLWTRKLSQK